jgi:hypothetical protein
VKERRYEPTYEVAPSWAGEGRARARCPELVVLDAGGEAGEEWSVATRWEVGAISDSDSPIGNLLRPHARVMRLRDLSYN